MSTRNLDDSLDMYSGECSDMPSDESLSVSFEGAVPLMATSSRLSSLSAPPPPPPFGSFSASSSFESLLSGLGRESDLKLKYPEFTRIVQLYREAQRQDGQVMLPAEETLFREMVSMCRQLRRVERSLRDREKEYDALLSQNKQIKETYVKIYAKAEQEEEYISNILLKRIQKLKNDKETLAQKYEQEEEYLTNDLMRRIQQLQSERDSLEGKMKTEQGALIDNLLQTIRRMETEMANSRKNMDRMRKEKIDQENALENEQELLFNTLGKQMDQLNNEKRKLQLSLQKAYEMGFVDAEDVVSASSAPPSVEPVIPDRPPSASLSSGEMSPSLKVSRLHSEIGRLRSQLRMKENLISELSAKLELKEQQIRDSSTTCPAKDKLINTMLDAVQKYLVDKSLPLERNEMGPPSVPSTAYNDVADMDDASSRGSFHSDMN